MDLKITRCNETTQWNRVLRQTGRYYGWSRGGFRSDLTIPASQLMSRYILHCIHVVILIRSIRTTYFHRFSNIFTNSYFLSSPIFPLMWNMKNIHQSIAREVSALSISSSKITSLAIVTTTRKQILPSIDRKPGG